MLRCENALNGTCDEKTCAHYHEHDRMGVPGYGQRDDGICGSKSAFDSNSEKSRCLKGILPACV